jgi:enolase
VPSGASTGTHEAHELRDGDRLRGEITGLGSLQVEIVAAED